MLIETGDVQRAQARSALLNRRIAVHRRITDDGEITVADLLKHTGLTLEELTDEIDLEDPLSLSEFLQQNGNPHMLVETDETWEGEMLP